MQIQKPWKKQNFEPHGVYTEKDYAENFSLKMERASIISALTQNQNYNIASFKLGMGKSSMLRKIKLHQIELSEWYEEVDIN